jgi:hypothetical protein
VKWEKGMLAWYLYNDGYGVACFKPDIKEVRMYDFRTVRYIDSGLTDSEIRADAQKIAEELDL